MEKPLISRLALTAVSLFRRALAQSAPKDDLTFGEKPDLLMEELHDPLAGRPLSARIFRIDPRQGCWWTSSVT
jgi:hypothetical protein